VHPKKANQLSDAKERQLVALLNNPRVGALGEVGLDYSDPSTNREQQKTVLRKVLGHCKPDHVLVLHIRGTDEDRLSAIASRECLEIVRAKCQPEQQIHLHCFSGGLEQYREWRAAFPDCYFGFTGKVAHFNSAQREALLRVRSERLLLETDAPYMPPLRKLRTTSPAYIGDVAAIVASARNQSIEEVLVATEANGRQLYRSLR
jgi:TatD DNase family protein